VSGWNDLLEEVKAAGSTYDVIRRRYLGDLAEYTGRNVIVYYSGWLQKEEFMRRGLAGFDVNDSDKNGFMAVIHKLDRSKGLDLILHTPGGETAATESLVDYLRSMFGTDVRAIVPQLAMSAGTMIACSCREIIMGKHSSLGPIDPQYAGIAAHGVIEEFTRAATEIQANQALAYVWQPILAKYTPTLIGECQKAIAWSNEMVQSWLTTGMFDGVPDAPARAERIVEELGSHALTLSHARHISMTRASDLGLKVTALEDDGALQDRVLTVHHACIQTLTATPAFKIIENHNGVAFIQTIATAIIAQPAGS
jgi:membrane-bound ClpP family serine protease